MVPSTLDIRSDPRKRGGMKKLLPLPLPFGRNVHFRTGGRYRRQWKGTAEGPNGPIERTFTFKVDGGKLTGETLRRRGCSPFSPLGRLAQTSWNRLSWKAVVSRWSMKRRIPMLMKRTGFSRVNAVGTLLLSFAACASAGTINVSVGGRGAYSMIGVASTDYAQSETAGTAAPLPYIGTTWNEGDSGTGLLDSTGNATNVSFELSNWGADVGDHGGSGVLNTWPLLRRSLY